MLKNQDKNSNNNIKDKYVFGLVIGIIITMREAYIQTLNYNDACMHSLYLIECIFEVDQF